MFLIYMKRNTFLIIFYNYKFVSTSFMLSTTLHYIVYLLGNVYELRKNALRRNGNLLELFREGGLYETQQGIVALQSHKVQSRYTRSLSVSNTPGSQHGLTTGQLKPNCGHFYFIIQLNHIKGGTTMGEHRCERITPSLRIANFP